MVNGGLDNLAPLGLGFFYHSFVLTVRYPSELEAKQDKKMKPSTLTPKSNHGPPQTLHPIENCNTVFGMSKACAFRL